MMISSCRSRVVAIAIMLTGMTSAASAQSTDKWFTQAPTRAASRVVGPSATVAAETGTAAPTKQPAAGDSANFSQGPVPMWIWGKPAAGERDRFYFRTEFTGGTQQAALIATCDNVMTITLNGQTVASSSEWQAPVRRDVQKFIKPGSNTLLVEAANESGPAGFVLKLVMEMSDGSTRVIVSDKSWQAATTANAANWVAASELTKLGGGPWGDVFNAPASGLASSSPRDVFTVLPGFQVELLYTVPKATQGSWVCLTTDPKGRLIASDQDNKGLYRITPPRIGSDEETKVEALDVKITAAQGMQFAFDSLYVSVNGGPGSGLYRVRDTNGDDQFDEVQKLKSLRGGGEHGPHSLRLSPDGKSLFVIAGNHTQPPENFQASRIPSNWGEDLLLPRQWDARGHARGILAPGGWIAKTDPMGQHWEIFSIGYRNQFDMDFNADGELFAYDADMEWDMGTPWYRPTRVTHATSGSEFGWRSGTGKWPSYYIDSLPPLLDIGPGSPVGATFGYGTKFPAKYQKAFYILDWTFGTMYALHLTPDGASYTATKEEFVSRTPLPLTDVSIGTDGAMYFLVGGRGAQSELFRVTYVGNEPTAAVDARDQAGAELRAERRKLEAFHGATHPEAVEVAWPYLSHADRFIRYAARLAIEAQPAQQWQERALTESNPLAQITALVGLARQGDQSLQPRIVAALNAIDYAALPESQQLDLLRAYALTFIRMGQPEPRMAASVVQKLDGFYPAKSDSLNRELCALLCYVNSPTVIAKTLEMMAHPALQSPEDIAELLARNAGYGNAIAKMLSNLPELQNIHYAFCLRTMRYGWTLEQREKYFQWFNAALQRSGGASYEGFINNIRTEAMANLSPAEKIALESKVVALPPKESELPKPQGPGHAWTTAELVNLAGGGLSGRNFERGKRAYAASRCIVCHRFDGEGGATGPDLSNVAGRFSVADLAESLIDPSKVISDQYRASVLMTKDGRVITGRVIGEANGKLTVMTDPQDATKIAEIAKDNIEEMMASPVSLMPKALLDVLNQEEVSDLLAYLLSRGNPNDVMFAK